MEELKEYPDPKEWFELMKKAKGSNYTDKDCISKIADMVNVFKQSENESDAYMVCKLEFVNRIPNEFHYLIE